MKDLNALKNNVLQTKASPQYFETGRYTARVVSVDYVEREDKDDLIMFKFFIEDAYPESRNQVNTWVNWGKKVNENNILDISDALCQIAGKDIDLNAAMDTKEQHSCIRNFLCYVDVSETSWNGKPFFSVKFKTHEKTEEVQQQPVNSWNDTSWQNGAQPKWSAINIDEDAEKIKPF